MNTPQNPAAPSQPVNTTALNQLLSKGVEIGASDIHLRVGEPPQFRVNGKLRPLQSPPLTADDARALCHMLLSRHPGAPQVDQIQEFDFSYQLPQTARFRVNVFRQKGTMGAVIRIIPDRIPTLDQLMLPKHLGNIADAERGLTLVTGATGSGKSTTLAGMLRHVNETRTCHILTIEDPIEYVHKNEKASISQREVGADTPSFHSAFRAALRQDPDVILVGEIRDEETMDMALKAAETGHMVYSTLHTSDTARTVNRLLALFPPEAQSEVRMRLADALVGIISQRLLPRKDGKGRVPAVEVLLGTNAVKDAIRDPTKADKLREYQESGASYGMQTFDQHLMELFTAGLIAYDVARAAATSASNFEREVSLLKAGSGQAAEAARAAAEQSGFGERREMEYSFEDLASDLET